MLLVALAAAGWLALLVAAPLLPVPLAAALYAAGSHICHQRPERSFHLFAAQLPVCARCLGIYAGAAAGSLLTVTARARARSTQLPSRMTLLCGALPTAATLLVEWSGAWTPANGVRAAAGIPLGFAAALVVSRSRALPRRRRGEADTVRSEAEPLLHR